MIITSNTTPATPSPSSDTLTSLKTSAINESPLIECVDNTPLVSQAGSSNANKGNNTNTNVIVPSISTRKKRLLQNQTICENICNKRKSDTILASMSNDVLSVEQNNQTTNKQTSSRYEIFKPTIKMSKKEINTNLINANTTASNNNNNNISLENQATITSENLVSPVNEMKDSELKTSENNDSNVLNLKTSQHEHMLSIGNIAIQKPIASEIPITKVNESNHLVIEHEKNNNKKIFNDTDRSEAINAKNEVQNDSNIMCENPIRNFNKTNNTNENENIPFIKSKNFFFIVLVVVYF